MYTFNDIMTLRMLYKLYFAVINDLEDRNLEVVKKSYCTN